MGRRRRPHRTRPPSGFGRGGRDGPSGVVDREPDRVVDGGAPRRRRGRGRERRRGRDLDRARHGGAGDRRGRTCAQREQSSGEQNSRAFHLHTDPNATHSGDPNRDGAVDITDMTMAFNDAGNFVTGYVNTDLNGDDVVDFSDIQIAFNNSRLFVVKITP